MVVPLETGLFQNDREHTQIITNTASVRCGGASITQLEITRRRRWEDGKAVLAIRPDIELRKGRDKLAILMLEVRQGDKLVSEVELVMEIEEGKANRRVRPVKLFVPTSVESDPALVLRIRFEVEAHD
jgi:hypothetical protein